MGLNCHFLALKGGGGGSWPRRAPQGLGTQNPTKKLTHLVDLLGHLLSRNHVSNFSVTDTFKRLVTDTLKKTN